MARSRRRWGVDLWRVLSYPYGDEYVFDAVSGDVVIYTRHGTLPTVYPFPRKDSKNPREHFFAAWISLRMDFSNYKLDLDSLPRLKEEGAFERHKSFLVVDHFGEKRSVWIDHISRVAPHEAGQILEATKAIA